MWSQTTKQAVCGIKPIFILTELIPQQIITTELQSLGGYYLVVALKYITHLYIDYIRLVYDF